MSQFAAPDRAGLDTVRVGDPHAEAARLASELDAEVAADGATAERAVRERVDAGRRAIGADDEADDELLRRADEIRAAAAQPAPLSMSEVDQLRQLAEDVARAARIKQRTEARFAETLQAKVAASSGVALHPSAVLAAAKAVTDAEAAVLKAEQNIADLGPEPAAFDAEAAAAEAARPSALDGPDDRVGPPRAINPDGPVLTRPDDVFDEVHLERKRSRTRAMSMFVLLVGIGLVCLGVGLPVPLGAGLMVIGLLLALLELQRGRRVTAELAADRADVGSSLANMDAISGSAQTAEGGADGEPDAEAGTSVDLDDAPADEPEPEPEPDPIPVGGVDHRHAAWVERRIALDASKEEAEERLRVAKQRWHQLAGPDADPHEPETVVRTHDPQLQYSDSAAEASPTVRTVAAFHRKAQAKWKVLWASYGRDDAPEPDALEDVLEELLGPHRAAVAEAERLAAAEARRAAAAVVQRPLVLVEPSTWWAPGRLDQLLSSVPPDGRVVLVERL